MPMSSYSLRIGRLYPCSRRFWWGSIAAAVLLLLSILTPRSRAAGPAFLVKDIIIGGEGSITPSAFTQPVAVNDVLFFVANDGEHGEELWKSDGTETGTVLVKDLKAGRGTSYPENLTNLNGMLFFTADDKIHGTELWKSDGTEAGTVLVKDINPGANPYENNSSYPQFLTDLNGTLFFAAYDSSGLGLWKSDGSEAGTVKIATNIGPHNLMNVGGMLFFTAHDAGLDDVLWKSDGTPAGTVRIKLFSPVPFTRPPQPPSIASLANINGTLFFTAYTSGIGYEVWKSNGTAASTVRVSGSGFGYHSPLGDFTNVNGMLFFRAYSSNFELWKSDSTAAGTVRVKSFGDLDYLASANGVLFFKAIEQGAASVMLWKSDGTATGTVPIKQLDLGSKPTNVCGTLFLTASDGSSGSELWRSDGTPSGTVEVQDIAIGAASSNPEGFTVAGRFLFFSADDIGSGRELWTLPLTPVPSQQPPLTGSYRMFLPVVGQGC